MEDCTAVDLSIRCRLCPETGLLGGRFDYNFEYDYLYRLTGATGHFEGAESEHKYELSMSYSPTGSILSKNQVHQSRDNGEPVWETREKNTQYVAGGDSINYDKKLIKQKDAIQIY